MMRMPRVSATIDGHALSVPSGTTIAQAAEQVHVRVPQLCKHPDLPPTGACGLCIVKVQGSTRKPRACCTPVEDGMVIHTQDPELVQVRRTVIELILSRHPAECLSCGRNLTCELQRIAAEFNIVHQTLDPIVPESKLDTSTGTIVLDPRKCITCGRCLEVCQNVQNVWALSFLDRGFGTHISPAGGIPLAQSPCVGCGQCAAHCPTGAIREFDQTAEVWDHLRDPAAFCIAQIAPSVRVALGEAFGFPPGTLLTGKIYHALRRLGFRAVFDTNFGADVTVVEEGHELAQRLLTGQGVLPLITSCCPSWIDYLEKYYGDLIDCFSTVKSPHAIVGVLAKTYFARQAGIDPASIYGVSVMPCTAKKYEIQRSRDMFASGRQDVDCVLTTREFARMLKQSGVDFAGLDDAEADDVLGDYSGAGTIFGVTGGVMEAALRTAHWVITGRDLPGDALEFQPVRGLRGVKQASVPIDGHVLQLAVAHGLGHVASVLDRVRAARQAGHDPPFHFIEVMACPGGCVGGGGQPYGITDAIRAQRAAGLYRDDRARSHRCAHHNAHVHTLYDRFPGKPLGPEAHRLLHTSYTPRPLYQR